MQRYRIVIQITICSFYDIPKSTEGDFLINYYLVTVTIPHWSGWRCSYHYAGDCKHAGPLVIAVFYAGIIYNYRS